MSLFNYPLIQNCLHCLLPPHPNQGQAPPPVPPPSLPPPHPSRDLASAAANRMAYMPTQITRTASTCVPAASPMWGSAGPDPCLMTRANAVHGPESEAIYNWYKCQLININQTSSSLSVLLIVSALLQIPLPFNYWIMFMIRTFDIWILW